MAKMIMTVAQMADRKKWLELRNIGIGGSEAAVIAGFSKWKSPFQLWLEKTGQVEAEDISDNEYVYWGTVLEQAVADRFCELTGKKVHRSGMMQDDVYPFMLASIDRQVVGEKAGLECKTTNAFAGKDWEDDKVPDAYYLQCQWYMAVTGYEKWYIACLIGGNHFVWKEIQRSEDDIATLREMAVDFWDKVQNKIMPEVDGSNDCSAALQKKFTHITGDPVAIDDIKDAVDELKEVKETTAALSKRQKELENKIKKAIGEGNGDTATIENKVVATWKLQPGRVTIDSKRLKAERPEVYDEYSKTTAESRVFKLK